jgi:hypothetical protein
MAEPLVPLYSRLPELHRTRDEEQSPPFLLRSYLALVERAFSDIHENIESLYHDLFIETCDSWVIPYIGDLLGTSHLSGDPWTLRADVADTIVLRRRKGTIGAVELLALDLTGWAAHAIELFRNLAWSQHLNHQRPDTGGAPAFARINQHTVIRGGTATLRDPATLSLLGTPFDPFAHLPDFSPPTWGQLRYNLPNLAVFLWRLAAYAVRFTQPGKTNVVATGLVSPAASQVVRVEVHPLAEPLRLFNTFRWDPDVRPLVVTQLDAVPGPMPPARLTTGDSVGHPDAYVAVETYNTAVPAIDPSEVGLRLHLPDSDFASGETWTFRGANLCAWEPGLRSPLALNEIAIDPVLGRLAIGLDTIARATAAASDLRVTYTYGAVGPIGAHPISRPAAPAEWDGQPVPAPIRVSKQPGSPLLEDALVDLHLPGPLLIVEIEDSGTYDFSPDLVSGRIVEDGGPNLALGRPLILRAADGERPIIRLAAPLRLRPVEVTAANPADQPALDARNSNLVARLEGLYLTHGGTMAAGDPLIARAALAALEIHDTTLEPGGNELIDHTRAPSIVAARLAEPYGFADPVDETRFQETPAIRVRRSITGPLFAATEGYTLELVDSIIDAGAGAAVTPGDFAVSGDGPDPSTVFGPPTRVEGVTILGRMRVDRLEGRGGIFVRRLEVQDNQSGCIKFSYFPGDGDRLPQNYGCVHAPDALLRFTSDVFGNLSYGQLAHTTDFRVRERGPGDDAMGATGFLLEAHRGRNLQIRLREFMPVGVRPLLVPVT